MENTRWRVQMSLWLLNGQTPKRKDKLERLRTLNLTGFYFETVMGERSQNYKRKFLISSISHHRHNPTTDGRILLGKVDCANEQNLCKRHHVQGYPSIRIFRRGNGIKNAHGTHDHESYYGNRDTNSLVEAMEHLVTPSDSRKFTLDVKFGKAILFAKRPAPREVGCRIEGFIRVKKVPDDIIVSARSESHSFDALRINMSHVINNFNFGKKIEHYLQVVKTEVMSSSYQLIEESSRHLDTLDAITKYLDMRKYMG
ncbi:putative Thioredoxin domain-containing protein [Helianthus annuus]|nr:putative Thioredoxin domain-containing protein [Helianthus annuus]KAJ0598549.1 putative Thioredoxin domain-containing protein [Helianthus annuus]KAJ0759146.1 putative Thioredoxin domain-containing protein [Helianthus annuus]